MTKPLWIASCIVIISVCGIYAVTLDQITGPHNFSKLKPETFSPASSISTDSILFQAKKDLPEETVNRLGLYEISISRGDVKSQKLEVYKHLARFWKDTARKFEPYAWYTGEAARLENSEKSLTFAAHLFLENLSYEEIPLSLKQWEALQAKDLFERSLKVNPENDSSKVGLGAVYLYGGLSTPMKGIGMIKEVADRDSANIYAQITLGKASMASGQLDKAIDRFKRIVQLQKNNIEALLLLGGVEEQMGNKDAAIEWYTKSLNYIKITGLKKEIAARIAELKK